MLLPPLVGSKGPPHHLSCGISSDGGGGAGDWLLRNVAGAFLNVAGSGRVLIDFSRFQLNRNVLLRPPGTGSIFRRILEHGPLPPEM